MNARLVAYNIARRWKKLKRTVRGDTDHRRLLLERMPKQGICAEIGVWQGEFTARILRITKPRELHLIDPWLYQPDFSDVNYGGRVATSQADMDAMHARVAGSVGSLPGVTVHRAMSSDALKSFADGTFDWLYIDGNHAYAYVCEDLGWAFRKVRAGGFIAGDDYNWGAADAFPVRRALDEFVERHALHDRVEILGSQFILQKR